MPTPPSTPTPLTPSMTPSMTSVAPTLKPFSVPPVMPTTPTDINSVVFGNINTPTPDFNPQVVTSSTGKPMPVQPPQPEI